MTPAEREHIADLVVALVAATRVEQDAQQAWLRTDAPGVVDSPYELKYREAFRSTEVCRRALDAALTAPGQRDTLYERLYPAAYPNPPVSS